MSTNALKLLERMRRTKSGWGQKHFHQLLSGFGFKEAGKKHAIYTHPEHPEFRVTVPRHKSVREYVTARVVKVVDELLEKIKEMNNGQES